MNGRTVQIHTSLGSQDAFVLKLLHSIWRVCKIHNEFGVGKGLGQVSWRGVGHLVRGIVGVFSIGHGVKVCHTLALLGQGQDVGRCWIPLGN